MKAAFINETGLPSVIQVGELTTPTAGPGQVLVRITAAAVNPILQQDELNFRPQQLSELLRGNTTEDNAVLQQIAGRLVQHQHTTEPAPQAIIISLPEEGAVYTFSRSVQVAENAPLELDLDFDSQIKLHFWQILAVLALLLAIAGGLSMVTTRQAAA